MYRSGFLWLALALGAALLGWAGWPAALWRAPEPVEAPVLARLAEVPDPGEPLAAPALLPTVGTDEARAAEQPSTPPPAEHVAGPGQVAAATPVAELEVDGPCVQPAGPLPRSGQPGAAGFWQQFREPLPPAPLWNPPGPKRVGLQAGHWRVEEAPPELSGLQHGTSGGGKQEWEVNLDIAERARALLERAGVQVDVLPAVIPPRYRAHAFVSIHADGDPAGLMRGFKIARPGFSSVPEADDRLVEALYASYEAATGLPRDDAHITRRMLYYYAFNSRRYCHAVAPGVPQAIIETGFLTSAIDRQVLLGNPEAAARGIAEGLLVFLFGPEAPALP